MIRVDGDMRKLELPPLEHKDVYKLIYDIMSDKQRTELEENLECDFSFEIPKIARFRVNAFNQNRGIAAVFRTIPSKGLPCGQSECCGSQRISRSRSLSTLSSSLQLR